MINIVSDRAYAVKVGQRYYRRRGKGRRVLTAWSIAGATLYVQFAAALKIARQIGRNSRVVGVGEER